MGEEYADYTPFLYLTSHSDPDLAKAVWKGRKTETGEYTPDPQDKDTSIIKDLLGKTLSEGAYGYAGLL